MECDCEFELASCMANESSFTAVHILVRVGASVQAPLARRYSTTLQHFKKRVSTPRAAGGRRRRAARARARLSRRWVLTS